MRQLLLFAVFFLIIPSAAVFAESISSEKSTKATNTSPAIWVVDIYNCRVEKFDNKENYLSQFGSCGSGDGQFNLPTRLAIDSKGNIWVVDTLNNRVQKFDSHGQFLNKIGGLDINKIGKVDANKIDIEHGQFAVPVDAAIDSNDNLWVLDGYGRIQQFDSNGNYLRQFGSQGTEKGQFYQPTAIAIDHNDNIWVADVGRVQEFDSTGAFLKNLGIGLKAHCLASFKCNMDHYIRADNIAVDSSNNLWLMEPGQVRKMSNNADYKTFRLPFGAAPGSFFSPHTLAVDGNGNLWITDTAHENSRIQILNNNGVYLSQFGSTGKGNGQFEGIGGIVIH